MSPFEAHCLCVGDEVEERGRLGQVARKGQFDFEIAWIDWVRSVYTYEEAHNIRKVRLD